MNKTYLDMTVSTQLRSLEGSHSEDFLRRSVGWERGAVAGSSDGIERDGRMFVLPDIDKGRKMRGGKISDIATCGLAFYKAYSRYTCVFRRHPKEVDLSHLFYTRVLSLRKREATRKRYPD